MTERIRVDATGHAHVEGEPDLPRAVVDLDGVLVLVTDPWIVENVLLGDVRLPPRPPVFLTTVDHVL